MIEVYRIINGIEAIDWKLLFSKAPYDGTRGHTMKLEKKVICLDIFSQRVIDYWNALPQTAIDVNIINQFKSQLKIHLNNIIRGLHKPLAFSLFPTPLLNIAVRLLKSFEMVPHDGLLSKIKHYGIDDKIWLWIYNFIFKTGYKVTGSTLATDIEFCN